MKNAITLIIITECDQGKFSLARFYQRRIARIFPVSFLVLIVTLIVASIIYTPQDFASVGTTAIAATLSIANLKMMMQGNYFEAVPDAQPLLHYWSLSIEEQFYLVIPSLILIAFKFKTSRYNLFRITIVIAAISFIGCCILTEIKPTWAFYLLPTRAWELLVGCALALFPFRENGQKNLTFVKILAHLGLLIIFISLFTIHESTSFPGSIAIFPVIGSILVLFASNTNKPEGTIRFLSHPYMVFIGKISYSLYLWHWPIFCFVDYYFYSHSLLIRAILKIIFTCLLSLISYNFFENPIRTYLNKPKRKMMSFIIFLAFIGLITFAGFVIRNENYLDASTNSVKNGGIVVNSYLSKPSIVLMGDSNGSMYGRMLKEISREMKLRAHIISVAGSDALPGQELYRDSISFLNQEKPDITIFVESWTAKIGQKKELLPIALSEILQSSKNIILITQPPILPKSANRSYIRNFGQFPIVENISTFKLRKKINAYLMSQQNNRIHVLNIEPMFVQSNGEIRFTDEYGHQLYHDSGHLSGYGSDIVKKQIKSEIKKILLSSYSKNSNL